MVSNGRPESQGNRVDTVGGAVLVDDRNGPETMKKIKHLRIHFNHADQKKRIPAALREIIHVNESSSGKYKKEQRLLRTEQD